MVVLDSGMVVVGSNDNMYHPREFVEKLADEVQETLVFKVIQPDKA